jgi:hypothetical protein
MAEGVKTCLLGGKFISARNRTRFDPFSAWFGMRCLPIKYQANSN